MANEKTTHIPAYGVFQSAMPDKTPGKHPAFTGEPIKGIDHRNPPKPIESKVQSPKAKDHFDRVRPGAIIVALVLMLIVGLGLGARAATFLATNNLGSTVTVAVYSTNSAGQFTLTTSTPVTNGTPQTLTYTAGATNNGIAVINTTLMSARVNTWAALANTNGANTSYLATNGTAAYYALAVGPFSTNVPQAITSVTNTWTNSTH